MIIDSHVKIGPRFTGKDHSVAAYRREMEAHGIDKALLCANKPLSYAVSEGNETVEQALRQYPDKFFGAVRVDPWQREKALTELDHRLVNKAFKAIYLHPGEENFQCNRGVALPIMDYAAAKGLPVIIESGYTWVSHISQIGDLARKYPQVKIMVTNAGQLDLSGLTLSNVKYTLNKYSNLYLGTAVAVAAEWLADLVQKTARGRILFETGYPLFEPYLEKYRIDKAYLEAVDRQQVYCDNVKVFFGLTDEELAR